MVSQKGKIGLFFVVLLVVLGVCIRVEAITIAENGVARAVIVVDQNAPESEQYAAIELAGFLQQVTGAEFEILNEADGSQSRLLVGPEAAKLADASFSTAGLGAEGIVIQTVGDDLILAGGYPRGTIYSVYTFLEDVVGCHWWSSTASTIPNEPTLEVGSLDVRYVPILEWRETLWYDAFDGDWSVRNKCNGHWHELEEKHGGKQKYAGWFVHTFNILLPPNRYFADHPEWYSKVGGERTTLQLCLTNEEMQAELVKNLKALIRRYPDATITSVSQNDRGGYCECSNCAALDATEGSQAGSLLHFVNAVAEDIEAEFPEMLIHTLAYTYTRKPPKYVRPRHNVVVQLCSIECSFSKPLNHVWNVEFRSDLINWGKICNRLYIWDYTTNFRHYVMPHPNLHVLGPNIDFFVNNNVKGVFEQGAFQCHGAEMAELRAWVLAKKMWDPRLDDQQLIDEFLEGYYGPAGVHVKACLDTFHDAVEAKSDWLGCYSPHTADFLTFQVLNEGMIHLKAAEQAVEIDPELRFRVHVAQLPIIYVFLRRWDELLERAVVTGADWPLPCFIEEAFDFFMTVAVQKNITRLNESEAGFGVLEEAVEEALGHDYIQRAIDGAKEGDEIVIREGIYNEGIDFRGKNLILRSTDPNDPNVVAATVINGGSEDAAVAFSRGEDSNCVLSGFTIIGGNRSTIHCYDAFPIISNCTIDAGTGIAFNLVYGSNPTVINCTVAGEVIKRPIPENLKTGKKYAYIQEAIDDANVGDVIFAPEGVYEEVIDFKGKNLTLQSANPSDPTVIASTVIEGGHEGLPVVTFSGGEEPNCLLTGFTITGGSDGIYCSESSPTISNCDIFENGGDGTCVYDEGHPAITKCIIADNGGAGIQLLDGSYAPITNCIITDNGADGIHYEGDSLTTGPTISNCVISENKSAGIDFYLSKADINNCTITGNGAEGIIFKISFLTITNCILWDSLPPQILKVGLGTITVNYSDIQGGWAGQYNIDADPCFVEPQIWDSNQGLVSYWKFDEGSGDVVSDSAGDNNGIVHGGAWTTGQIGGALGFDGVDDYVDICDNADLDLPGRFTIMFWVNFNSMSSYQGVLTKEDYVTERGYSFQLVQSRKLRWRVNNSTKITGPGMSEGIWTHIAVTTDGIDDIFYVNGLEKAREVHTAIKNNNEKLMFGKREALDGDEYFNGLLDEVIIYKRGLSFEEIQQRYQAGLSGHGLSVVEFNEPNSSGLYGDYYLLEDSLCIDAGDPGYIAGAGERDVDGRPRILSGRIDMGACEFNHIPVADAGPNQVTYADHTCFGVVTLDGSGSYDEDGQDLSYKWSWAVDSNTFDSSGNDSIINMLDFGALAKGWSQKDDWLDGLPMLADAWLCTPSSWNWEQQCDIAPAGPLITIKLPVGEHIIELIVNDGIDYSEPNEVVVTVVEPIESFLCTLPSVIQRRSHGRGIMLAMFSLPDGIRKEHINEDEVLTLYYCDRGIEAIRQYIFDIRSGREGTAHAVIFAIFSSPELLATISDNGPIALHAVGRLRTGQYFTGSDTIIIKP